jgi:hypothetical protein
MNIDEINISELDLNESVVTSGGDRFMYDFTWSIARIGRWLHDTGNTWVESIGQGGLYHPGKI